MDAPLILTLALDAKAERVFDEQRKQHFPPERNFLAAHLTLFHHLPSNEPQILQDIRTLCTQQKIISLHVADVVSIGGGVAYKIKSDALQQLHKYLQQQWQPWLTPQDKQTLWPHVTVQNKAAPQTARDLLQHLKSSFVPFEITGLGMRLWNYLNGPWEFVEAYLFED